MPDIALRLERDTIIVEGAMGTMLQSRGMLDSGSCPEALNLDEPETIEHIHQLYREAGAEVAISNTFGGSKAKLGAFGLADLADEINRAGVRLARQGNPMHVLGDVGPCGLMMSPLGTATFDEVYQQYYDQVVSLAAEKPDGILIETMSDIADARCALIAARDACELPVFVTCTFDTRGFMELSGTTPEVAAIVLSKCGADVIGINCGFGPDLALPLVERMAAVCETPILAQPNAGMPVLNADGTTTYPATPTEMADWSVKLHQAGANLLGSCCGSTPAHTAGIYAALSGKDAAPRTMQADYLGVLTTSVRSVVTLGNSSEIKIVAQADAEDIEADLIDILLDDDDVDEVEVHAMRSLQPIIIDSKDPRAVEAALKVSPGRSLVNSISHTQEELEVMLPLAKKYGAGIVALAVENGAVPPTAQGRVDALDAIIEAALAHGFTKSDIVVDPAVQAAYANPTSDLPVLEATQIMADKGFATLLGISNISFKLASRDELDTSFSAVAAAYGMSACFIEGARANLEQALAQGQEQGAGVAGDETKESLFASWRGVLERELTVIP